MHCLGAVVTELNKNSKQNHILREPLVMLCSSFVMLKIEGKKSQLIYHVSTMSDSMADMQISTTITQESVEPRKLFHFQSMQWYALIDHEPS